MTKALPLQFAATLFLSVATGSSLAATASVSTEVNTLHEPNGVSTMFGCDSRPDCDRSSVSNATLLASDPDGVLTSSNLNFALFASTNTSGVPNYLHTGEARAQALLGSLHASAVVELTGSGGSGSDGAGIVVQGVSALAIVSVRDQIKVASSSLANGTVVTLNVLMAVSGQGRGQVGVTVRGSLGGVPGAAFFTDTDSVNRDLESLESISGQFIAEVGSTLTIDYFLRASTGVSIAAWQQDEIENGRARSSHYGNSAYLYFSAADPENVSIQGLAGYDYVLPNPVPLPAAIWLLLPGVAVIARRRRAGVGTADAE